MQPMPNHSYPDERLTDILDQLTVLKQQVATLRADNARLRARANLSPLGGDVYSRLFHATCDAIIFFDEHGYVIEWSDGATLLTGLDRADVIGVPRWELLSRLTPAEHKTAHAHTQLRRDTHALLTSLTHPTHHASTPQPLYHEIERPDGTRRSVSERLVPLTHEGKTVIASVSRDMTDRDQNEEAYRRLVDNALHILTIIQWGQIVFINAAATTLTGYAPDELHSMPISTLLISIHTDDRATLAHHITTAQTSNHTAEVTYRLHRRDGAVRWMQGMIVPGWYRGQPAVQMTCMDITERRTAEHALRASEAAFRAMFEQSRAVKLLIDPQSGAIVDANYAATVFYGYPRDTLLQMQISDINTLPSEQVHIEMERAHTEQRSYFLFQHRLASGTICDVEVYSHPLDIGGRTLLFSIIHDVTRYRTTERLLRATNELLHEQVVRDPLTTLYNRRYLDETLPHELQRARRHNLPVAVLMFDIDYFKRFNDTYGHDAGDTLLRAAGTFLRDHTRGDDIVCRYGGEEFILVLPGISEQHIVQRAEELRFGIEQLRVTHNGQPLATVTISIGAAVYPSHALTADALIKCADTALYAAKAAGRNRVVLASSPHTTGLTC